MRSGTFLPVFLVGLCAGFFVVPANASPLCHEEDGTTATDDAMAPLAAVTFGEAALEQPLLSEGGGDSALSEPASGAIAQVEAAEDLEEVILPCAMVESDQLGPWCVDAAVYLVTTKGTLLCRVSLPAVDLVTADSSDLEDRSEAPAPSRTQMPVPAASIASAVKDASRPLVLSVASSLERLQRQPHPVYAEPPFVPG